MLNYIFHILIMVGIFSILALSLDIALGYSGIFNIAHAALWGVGAYTSGLFTLHLGVPFFLGLILGGIVAVAFSFILGLSVSKVKGDFLALVTHGFGVIVVDVARNWIGLTGGPRGLVGVPYAKIFKLEVSSPSIYFWVVLFFVLFTYFVLSKVVKSPFGLVLEGIREDELVVSMLGINTKAYKIRAFMVSAFFAGIAGGLYAHYFGSVDPNRFSIMVSFTIISMVIIGGVASLNGALIGAMIFIVLPEIINLFKLSSSDVAAIRQILYSFLILIILIFKPKGILGRDVLIKRH